MTNTRDANAAPASSTLAHIHDAYAGNAGAVQVPFAHTTTSPDRWDLPATTPPLTQAQVDRLLAGALYVNVHSGLAPGGEIRSQIKPSNIRVVYAAMSVAQEVRPTGTAPVAAGIAAVTVDTATNQASVHVNSTGVDTANLAHIHLAITGANSAPLFPLTHDTTSAPARPGHWFVEKQPITADDITDLDQATLDAVKLWVNAGALNN